MKLMVIFAKHNPVEVPMMNFLFFKEFGKNLNFKFVGKIRSPWTHITGFVVFFRNKFPGLFQDSLIFQGP